MDSFKTLSFDDVPSRHRLHRSMSFSEISPRKEINIAQQLLSGPSGNAVLRQYSYHELGVVPGTTSLRYSQKFVSEFHIDLAGANSCPDISLEKNLTDKPVDTNEFIMPNEKRSRLKTETGYMKETKLHHKRSHDSSKSGGAFKRLKLLRVPSDTYSAKKVENTPKLKGNSTINDEDKEHSRSIVQLLFVIVPLLVAVLAALGTQYAAYQKICEASLDINASDRLLSSSIFGQQKAVKSVIEIVRKFNSSDKNDLHVMVLTGPTGVGKTYTASLLEEIFPWKHNIHHFIMPIDFENLSEHSLQKYPYCGDHLVIMDDLRVEDIKDVAHIVSYLKKLAEKSKVIAVLIFKFHKQLSGKVSENEILEMSDEVLTNLIQRGVEDCVLIDFKTLEKADVIECIKRALERHWIPVSDDAVNTILEQVDYHSEGCKRISSKIAVVNELWARQP